MQILVLSFLKPQGWRWGGGEGGGGGVGRKQTLLKCCDLKGMTFTSICMVLSYAYSENLKSFLFFFFFNFQKRHAVCSNRTYQSDKPEKWRDVHYLDFKCHLLYKSSAAKLLSLLFKSLCPTAGEGFLRKCANLKHRLMTDCYQQLCCVNDFHMRSFQQFF